MRMCVVTSFELKCDVGVRCLTYSVNIAAAFLGL